MTMAAAIEGRTADARTWSKASRIASVDIVRNLASTEMTWRGLEQQFCTPYQRFDFLRAWQREVGEREGLAPFIVIAFDAERQPLLLLPLALRQAYGARCKIPISDTNVPPQLRPRCPTRPDCHYSLLTFPCEGRRQSRKL